MRSLLAGESARSGDASGGPPHQPTASGPGGDWPRTSRAMPWALAGFLVMLWLVPFDAVGVPISLPIESKLDRFVLGGVVLLWVVVACAAGRYGVRWRSNRVSIAVVAFLTVAVLTIAINAPMLNRLGELDLAIKKLALAISFAMLFHVVATTIRRSELRAFIVLTLVLACISALGTMVEYRTGVNHFYGLAADLLPGSFTVAPAPGDPEFGRANVVGPTGHGLAAAGMFAMALPFAVAGIWQAQDRRRRLLYALAVILLLGGAVATIRKTGLVASGAALLVLVAYKPWRMVRLLPLGVVAVVVIQVLAPGALTSMFYELTNRTNSTDERVADYAAVSPDIESRPALGRGFGSYDPLAHKFSEVSPHHRLLDNQYLMLLIETGIIGIAAYLMLMVSGVARVHRLARSRDPARAGPGTAIIAGVVAFAVLNFLFDTLGFPHVPYLFFCLLGFAVVAAVRPEQEPAAERLRPVLAPRMELSRA